MAAPPLALRRSHRETVSIASAFPGHAGRVAAPPLALRRSHHGLRFRVPYRIQALPGHAGRGCRIPSPVRSSAARAANHPPAAAGGGGLMCRSDLALHHDRRRRSAVGSSLIEWGGRDRSVRHVRRFPRTYVLDTSVLLADPLSLVRFDEHDVVLPIVVIGELEAKRDHPELGWAARQALRMLEGFRRSGPLDRPMPVNDAGGTLRVELNHQDTSGAARRAGGGQQRPPHPRRGEEPGRRRHTTSPSSRRTCRCG